MQQQLIQEFKTYPKAKQFEVIFELAKIYEEDLTNPTKNGYQLSEQEKENISRLREIGAIA